MHWWISLFMVLGSLPFVLYLRAVRGNLSVFLRDSQVRVFFAILLVAIGLTAYWLWDTGRDGAGTGRCATAPST